MTRRPHRLVSWQRICLVGAGSALGATGAIWLAVHYAMGAGAGELPHPLESWLMRLHGLAAFVALFTLGALAAEHVPQGWRLTARQRWASQRRLGVALCSMAAALVITGYALYYLASESVRPALGIGHAAIGAATAVLVVWHGRRRPG
jgi:hypothetical protein